jgi:hypothetical protein
LNSFAAKLVLTYFLTFACIASAEIRPVPVTIGVYINDVQKIDLKNHHFTADIYIWFRWKAAQINPAESFEYTNPSELWGHSTKANYPKPVLLPNGELYQVVRTHGQFSQKFLLDQYPFDHQVLMLGIEDSVDESRKIEFILDENPVSINPLLRLPGFVIGAPKINVEKYSYPTNFGDSRLLGKNSDFSRVVVRLGIHRPLVPYATKFLLPILCVMFAAALMFLFSPNYVDSRVGIGITALLTIVALQITLNEDLPEIDYLVLIDKIYLSGYLFVISGLGLVVKTTWMIEKDPEALLAASQLSRRGLLVLTLVYIASVLYFVLPVLA